MVKWLLCGILISIHVGIAAQDSPGQYFIRFSDKVNTPFSLSQPDSFLSQRAIDRRDRYDITLDESDLPVDPGYVQQVEAIPGISVKYALKWANGVVAWLSDSTQLPVLSALYFVTEVRYVSPYNYMAKDISGLKSTIAKDVPPDFPPVNYGYAYDQSAIMNLDILHESGYTGEGMVIAVLDAGYNSADTASAYQQLFDEGKVLATRDFVNPGENVYHSHSHGTKVLSTMALRIDGAHIGTAPGASYILLRSENAATEFIAEEYNWMAAAEFADSAGADIINSSLGYTRFDDSLMDHSYQDMDGNTTFVTKAADRAASKGILVVTSAGNSGSNPWFHIGAPEDGDSVLAVGAINGFGEYATFSSKGPSRDGRVKPDLVAVGWGAAFVDINSQPSLGNGTSYASPVLAGAAACLWQHFPDRTNMDIIKALHRSAHQYGTPDSLLGYGIPDMAVATVILLGDTIPRYRHDHDITVSPNPFDGHILVMFETGGESVTDILLHDMSGRLVYSHKGYPLYRGYNAFQLRGLQGLAQGVYVLSVMTEGEIVTKRVVKYRQ